MSLRKDTRDANSTTNTLIDLNFKPIIYIWIESMAFLCIIHSKHNHILIIIDYFWPEYFT